MGTTLNTQANPPVTARATVNMYRSQASYGANGCSTAGAIQRLGVGPHLFSIQRLADLLMAIYG